MVDSASTNQRRKSGGKTRWNRIERNAYFDLFEVFDSLLIQMIHQLNRMKIHRSTVINFLSLTKCDLSAIDELQWEKHCDEQTSFLLYLGILKLSHVYTTTLEVVFSQTLIKLEAIPDYQQPGGLELFVVESPSSPSDNRTSFQVEVVINPEAISGSFRRHFLLKETSTSEQRTVRVNVRGKILRQDQGTPTLKDGVHMKSTITKTNDDDDDE